MERYPIPDVEVQLRFDRRCILILGSLEPPSHGEAGPEQEVEGRSQSRAGRHHGSSPPTGQNNVTHCDPGRGGRESRTATWPPAHRCVASLLRPDPAPVSAPVPASPCSTLLSRQKAAGAARCPSSSCTSYAPGIDFRTRALIFFQEQSESSELLSARQLLGLAAVAWGVVTSAPGAPGPWCMCGSCRGQWTGRCVASPLGGHH